MPCGPGCAGPAAPRADIEPAGPPAKNLKLVIKDGRVYKEGARRLFA
jgi:hypothetical protein